MKIVSAQKTWTILSLIETSANHLVERGFENARLNAELLLAHVLQCKRIELYLRFDRPVEESDLAAFRSLYKRRLQNEPLQYLLGETDFMGIRLEVDSRVLIPRPETEHLIEDVIALDRSRPGEIRHILDVGTGSGNIAIALAKFLPETTIHSIDRSAEALQLAERNIASHGLTRRVSLSCMDFLDVHSAPGSGFDLLVSNPPYISKEEFKELQPEVRLFEPETATSDGGDGLTFYHMIAARSRALVRPRGYVAVEIGFGQIQEISAIFASEGLVVEKVTSDYNKIPRVILAQVS